MQGRREDGARQGLRGLVALALALAACDAGPARLISDEELAEQAAAHAKRLARPVSCARSVLRGTPIPGEANLRELFEATDACAEGMMSLDRFRYKLPIDDPNELIWDARCGAQLVETVHRLVSHDEACAAREVGELDPRDVGLEVYRVAKRLAYRATVVARTDPDAAMWIVLDGLRLYQDESRGRVSLWHVVLSSTAKNLLLDAARDLLATATLRDPGALEAAMGILIATETPIRAGLEYEPDALVQMTSAFEVSAFDETALTYDRADAARHDMRGCPRTYGNTFKQCKEWFAQFPTLDVDDRSDARDEIRRLFAPATEDDRAAARRLRRAMLDEEPSLASMLDTYVDLEASRYARLTMLRIHLTVLADGHCPTAAELGRPRWYLKEPSLLGDRLVLTPGAAVLTVATPAWIDKREIWTIPCPN